MNDDNELCNGNRIDRQIWKGSQRDMKMFTDMKWSQIDMETVTRILGCPSCPKVFRSSLPFFLWWGLCQEMYMWNIRSFDAYLEVAHWPQSFLIYGVLTHFLSYYSFSVFQFLNLHFFYNGDSGEGIMYWYTQYTKQALGERAGHLFLSMFWYSVTKLYCLSHAHNLAGEG